MAELDIIIEEYFSGFEYLQGNTFSGLEYFELVEDDFLLNHSVYHVWNDLLSDDLNFTGAFTPYHNLSIFESFKFEEQFGLPIQVSATSLEVMYEQIVRPIDIAFFSLEVLHGVDIFWEEVSSGLHSTEYAQGVPYHFFENIDYLGLDINSVVVKVNFAQSLDRLNMRHEVNQFYNFNNIILDQFFIYDWLTISWGKLITESIDFSSWLAHYLSFTAYDYLIPKDEAVCSWLGNKTLNDTMFIWDLSKQVQGYTELLSESLDIVSLLQVPYFYEIISSLFSADDLELTNMKVTQIINEALKIQNIIIVSLQYLLGINDVLNYIDSFTLSNAVRDYLISIEDGFNLNVSSAANFLIYRILSDAILGVDSGLLNLIVSTSLEDSTSFNEEVS